jgi:pimeloyl-ACP methyl ester carboxylesterase
MAAAPLVGHFFGGSVALKAAALLGPRVGHLILLEQHNRPQAFLEARSLCEKTPVEEWRALPARTLVVSDFRPE